MLYRPYWVWGNKQIFFQEGFLHMFSWAPIRLCSLLSEKTSVLVSIAPVRPWVCPTCRECVSLTAAVTSMKTRASRWRSRSPMSSDTGKRPGAWALLAASLRPCQTEAGMAISRVRLQSGLRFTLLTSLLPHLQSGAIVYCPASGVFSVLTTCTTSITEPRGHYSSPNWKEESGRKQGD